MRYAVVIEKSPKGFGAYVPDLPGCVAVGDTELRITASVGVAVMRSGEDLDADGLLARATEALALFDRVIALGVPENLLDQAYFERGETLYGIGRFDQALESYRQVLERNPTRAGQLVERAQRRIDDIRFGNAPGQDGIPPAGGTG